MLDYSSCFIIAVLDEKHVSGRLELPICADPPELLLRVLKNFQIDVVICGAVSSELHTFLTLHGIEVIPCVRGRIDKVISAYSEGKLKYKEFHLPGS